MSGGETKKLTDFPITATFAEHTWTDKYKGDDYGTPNSTVCTVLQSGVVNRIYTPSDGGNVLQIREDDGKYREYVHITRALVVIGQRVNVGDAAFISGATGNVTGPHTHVNLWDGIQWDHTVDPNLYINNDDMTVDQDKKLNEIHVALYGPKGDSKEGIIASVGGDTRARIGDIFNNQRDTIMPKLKTIIEMIEGLGSVDTSAEDKQAILEVLPILEKLSK